LAETEGGEGMPGGSKKKREPGIGGGSLKQNHDNIIGRGKRTKAHWRE